MAQPDLTPDFEGIAILTRLDNLSHQMTTFTTGLTNQVTELTNQMTGLDRRVTGLTTQVTGLDRRVTELTNQVTGLDRRVTELTDETRARDANAMARLRNSMISGRDYPLSPLANPRTGVAIPGFPITPAALSLLSGQILTDILTTLGENVDPEMSMPEKQRMLRTSVGLVDTS